MHNLTKIKVFRLLLRATYLPSLIFIYPFAFLRKKNPSGLFMFLDRYALGGAQRVHLDILQSIGDVYKQVYFTRFSPNDIFKKEFYYSANADMKDIHVWCDNLIFRLFTVHFYSFYINRHKKAHIVSSNSTFFYDMLPFIKKGAIKTELLHNFTFGKNGMEFFGLANYKWLEHRLTVDAATSENIRKQYKDYNIPEEYLKRVKCIEPGVLIGEIDNKSYQSPINILYAGRGGAQKRTHLLNEIATRCIKQNMPVKFHFAGDVINELSNFVKDNAVLHGQITDPKEMYSLYQQCNVILMTSAYEGFPMLIKEGMANGCIPVVTALEGNKSHLSDKQNALLIHNPEDEDGVVMQGINLLALLANDNALLQQLSANAYAYAKQHFSKKLFLDTYRKLLLSN